ncbi:hypothetical protein HP550_13145 [Cellulomonas humilata]|uniref:Integral membrane protein n=1 Tax=Cellulomonas humilata TaxID=144055 RepID=A0A7Y6A1V1_9CELL|nr:hypothetical protein [Cellulomonas humilata]NUU18196.1 hypothetical protein [Cellulomonas humilata]
MDLVYHLLVVLHLLGWAIVLGGTLVNLRTPKIATGVLHGILTALVTGIALAGIASAGLAGHEPDTTKIAVKLVVAVVVTVLVVLGVRKPSRVTTGYLGAIAGLTALNVAIAVLWR